MIRTQVLHATPKMILAGLLALITLFFLIEISSVAALPEYSSPNRTGEPCATCHVNPGGGGPRTLRGMLWTNAGRPSDVPILEGILLAPGVDDPQELYDAACSGCHGVDGRGLSAISFIDYGYSWGMFRRLTLNGRPSKGMPSFAGQLTDEQLDVLVDYVVALNTGEVVPRDSYPLPSPPLLYNCSSSASFPDDYPMCRGN